MAERSLNLMVALLLAATLVLPGGYAFLALALSVAGLSWRAGLLPSWKDAWTRPGVRWLVLGIAGYVVAYVLVGIVHRYKIQYYEPLIPFFLAPFMLAGARRWLPAQRSVWLGFAFGALLAGFMAWFQVYHEGIARAHGAHGNAIPFGHIALLLSGASLCGYLYFHRRQDHWVYQTVCLAGVGAGFVASFLSGSKGGWFAIFLIFFVWAWRVTARRPLRVRLAYLTAIVLLFPALLWFAPRELVWDRLIGGLDGAVHWLSNGGITEGSVSIRLEIWRFGLAQFWERPVFGWPQSDAISAMRAHLRQFAISDVLANLGTFDNLLVETLMSAGFVGLAGLVCLFVGVLTTFGARYLSEDDDHRELALAGMLITVFVLGYGLSVNVLGINAFRQVYLSWAALWLALSLWSPASWIRPDKSGHTDPSPRSGGS